MSIPMRKLLADDVRISAGDDVTPERVAIIGTGPRGLSVIERIASRLSNTETIRPLEIYAIDNVEVGCGRLWRTDQPDWFIMNTRCKNATMFSNAPDGRPWRAGYGPTFMEWWKQRDTNFPGPSGYAPRVLYGKYLKFVLDVIELNLPEQVWLERVQDQVVDIAEEAGDFVLSFDKRSDALRVDRVIISSGYPDRRKRELAVSMATPLTRHLTSFDVLETFQSGLSLPADLSGSIVGIRGLGLSFYDVISELTLGRGGRYVDSHGALKYVPSGREPKLMVAGSRSGFPLPVRGKDDRPPGLAHEPVFFTRSRITQTRAKGPACFRTDYLPWITAEVNLVYLEKMLRQDDFADLLRALNATETTAETVLDLISGLANGYGIAKLLDLELLVTPFAGRVFDSQADFREAVISVIRDDIARADIGEYNDPVKAALDVLRHIRPLIRVAVDLGGLTRSSHQEFITKIAPAIAFLSTGPSRIRAKQMLALIEAGFLELLGPSLVFQKQDDGCVAASSAKVKGYGTPVDILVDAYVPAPDVDTEENPVIRKLADQGKLRNFMDVGGIEVTRKSFHPISDDGAANNRVHVLGIPTESARWFLHVGVIEPGLWDEFIDDADAIASSVIEALYPFGAVRTGPAVGSGQDMVSGKYLS